MKRVLASVPSYLLAVSLLLLSGCGGSGDSNSTSTTGGGGGASGDVIKLAVCGPMTGSGAAFGEMIKMGAQLKADEINASGGIDGRKVVLSIEDDKGAPSETTSVARKVAADKSICLVSGHFNSACSNTAKSEYNRKGVVQFSPGSTNVGVCVGSPWTFRNLYRDDYQGTFLAQYAQKILGLKKVAILYDNDDYGKGLMKAFKAEADGIGLAVVEPIPYMRERTQDFKPLVSRANEDGIDGIFISGLHNEAALIAKAAVNDLGLKVAILGGDGVMSEELIKLAGPAAEGMYVSTPFLFNTGNDSEAATTFLQSFEKKYEVAPDTWAALTYDAVGMALVGVSEVGTERTKLKDWFAACTTAEKGYTGVTGNTFFDKEGDCYSKGAHVAIVKDSGFVPAPKQMQ
jgi:branched-chain amino acid transport system substrate-binding protein